jgi:hypothetical protein
MDSATLAAYHDGVAAFAKEWDAQPAPVDLHDPVKRLLSSREYRRYRLR